MLWNGEMMYELAEHESTNTDVKLSEISNKKQDVLSEILC